MPIKARLKRPRKSSNRVKLNHVLSYIKKHPERVVPTDLINEIEEHHYFRKGIVPKSGYRGEDRLSEQVADLLREKSRNGKCYAVWSKIAHELPGPHVAFSNRMRNMGKNNGVADFLFMGDKLPKKRLCLELKVGKGKLSGDQEYFKNWCINTGTPYEEARTLEQVIKILKNHNII